MIARLVLTDVRNHAALTLAPDVGGGAGFVILTGENGAGKTNVLEAVSLLAPGRGLRRAALSSVARQGGPGGFGIAATLVDAPDAIPVEIATGTRADAPERRIVRVNGAPASAATLAEWLSVLWVTPAMDRLFTDPAAARRQFLDRLVLALFPGHAGHTSRYESAMRERNRLLAEPTAGDPAWLAALEAQMGMHGAGVAAARAETVALVGEALAAAPPGPFARARIARDGWSGEAADLAEALARGRSRDAAAGRALVGPHRDDLLVDHAEKAQPAALCSTGEQKALLLGLVLAHAGLVTERTGRPPILLLDEVAAHLDPLRRAALFERLQGRGQVWMTGTEAALFADAGSAATRVVLG
ncbi:DNA replication/repair protein RecF [uncultured Sphingomonas sp.]|uniref:DNA replication/repair protein RecF n=1 Tax=uncultured Sphingomonas sp. TaxID=158754 RepID=UPI0035CAB639